MKTIETKRLILRNFEERDYEDVYEFLSQRKEDEFEAYPDITYENGREHLAYRVHNDEFIAIQLKDTGKIIGNVYLGKRDFEARELGYIVNKDYQRRGYAREAFFRQNVYFKKDEDGNPLWQDTYVYCLLENSSVFRRDKVK